MPFGGVLAAAFSQGYSQGVLAGYSLGYPIRQDTAVSIHLYSPPLKDQDYQSADGHRKTLP